MYAWKDASLIPSENHPSFYYGQTLTMGSKHIIGNRIVEWWRHTYFTMFWHLYTKSGFEETYIDNEPNKNGKERKDYQEVMSGILDFDENGDGFTNTLSTSEDGLNCYEQFDILYTWESVDNLLAQNIDPTETKE